MRARTLVPMRSRFLRVTVAGAVAMSAALLTAPVGHTATSAAVFDDFDGPAGTPPNRAFWDYDVGQWKYNGQRQTYTRSSDNVRLDGAGNLVIAASKDGDDYTSGRLVTRGKVTMLHGTMSARIKMPSGQGISPAFWLLGADVDTVGWPRSGEIDLIEMPNSGTYFYSTIHGPLVDDQAPGKYMVSAEGSIDDLSEAFHTFWVTRSENLIVIGVDDRTLATFTPQSLTGNQQWVFDQPMYALLNVAVGDNAAGPPNADTPSPATMLVDWFRWEPA